MGVRGPVPKSAEAREYGGGAAHRPMPAARPAAVFGALERPKGMSAAARKRWDFYVGQAILRPLDANGLRTICELEADLEQLGRDKRKLLRKRKVSLIEFEMSVDGRRLEATVTARRGHLKQLCDRYGLNPMAGSRLSTMEGFTPVVPAGQQPQDNEVEQLIQ